jgi:hypothetical protein
MINRSKKTTKKAVFIFVFIFSNYLSYFIKKKQDRIEYFL